MSANHLSANHRPDHPRNRPSPENRPPRQEYKPQHWKYCRREWEPDFYSQEVSLKTMDAVRPAHIAWEAEGRLPRGCLTVLAGEHGSGKSLLAVDWAARVSRSAAAESRTDALPGEAVIAHAGDMTAELLRQRLDAAGAAPERIASLALGGPRGDEIPSFDDITQRVNALTSGVVGSTQVRLLVVDNAEAWAGNLHREPDPARLGFLLAWLAEVAALARVAIVVLIRLPSGGRAAMRKLDQLAAVAPVVYLAASDPERPSRKLLVTVKNNLAPHAPAAAFEIVTGRVAWAPGPVEASAAELLAPTARRVEERQERSFVGEWLLAALARGPVASPELFRQARECGISAKALRRAGKSLGLSPRKHAFDGPWVWQLTEGLGAATQRVNGAVSRHAAGAESRRAGGVSLRVGGHSAKQGDAADQPVTQEGLATQGYPEANASGSPANASGSPANASGSPADASGSPADASGSHANAGCSPSGASGWPVESDEDGRTWLEKLGQVGEVGPPLGDFADAEPFAVDQPHSARCYSSAG